MVNASMQPVSRFLTFTVEEQRGGTTCTTCIETLKLLFLALSCFVTETTAHIFTRLKVNGKSVGVGTEGCVYIFLAYSFKNSVQCC